MIQYETVREETPRGGHWVLLIGYWFGFPAKLCLTFPSATQWVVPYKTIEKLSTVMILYKTLEEQTPRVRHWVLLGNVRHSSRETKSMINDQWSKTFKYHIKASKTFDSKDPLWDVKSAALSSTWKCQTQQRKTAWHPRPSNGSKGLKHKTMVMRTNTTKIFGEMVKLCSCNKNPPNLSLLFWRPPVLKGKFPKGEGVTAKDHINKKILFDCTVAHFSFLFFFFKKAPQVL